MMIYISGAFNKTRFFATTTYALFSTHRETFIRWLHINKVTVKDGSLGRRRNWANARHYFRTACMFVTNCTDLNTVDFDIWYIC
jgi:hypothetical protein